MGCRRVPDPPARIIPFISGFLKSRKDNKLRPTFYKNLSEKINYEINNGGQQGAHWYGQHPGPKQINGYAPSYCRKTLGSAYPDDRTGYDMSRTDRDTQLLGNK